MELEINNSFGIGKIIHSRNKDSKNFFSYKAPYLFLDLYDSKKFSNIFSYNKFNLFSISNKNHGHRIKNKTLLHFAQNIGEKYSIKYSNILFMSIPRILGYAFNPISFYFFLNQEKKIIAVIYEVKNTFGDQIHYLDIGHFKNKSFKKNMYVSPFIEMNCKYEITLEVPSKNHIICKIHQFDSSLKSIFFASLDVTLNIIIDKNLVSFFFRNIFGSLKVILLIHYQAMKLFFKKSKFYPHKKNLNSKVNVE